MERIIKSKHFGLKEAKQLNDFLLPLSEEETNVPVEIQEEVLRLSSLYKPYDSLNEYVEGSAKWQEIVDKTKAYEDAQAKLLSMNYNREQILDECYPKSLNIYKHSITIELDVTSEYYDYDDNYNCDSYTQFRDCHFYTSNDYFNKKGISNWGEFFVPYTYKENYWDKDLIDNAIYTIETCENKLQAYSLCENIGIKLNELKILFDINKIDVYSSGWVSYDLFVKYNDKDYKKADILKLLEEAKVAKSLTYIHDDQYVSYPRNTPYVDFNPEDYKTAPEGIDVKNIRS
jgi:hypothetical protein